MFKNSKYKHTTGKEFKREMWYSDLRVNTNSANECTTICCGDHYLAVNWSCASGATIALIGLESYGKRKLDPALLRAHSASLCDMAFCPYDGTVLATSGEDAAVKLWSLPAAEDDLFNSDGLKKATLTLMGHKKRVDSIAFSPVCASLIASSSSDKTVRVWDLKKGASALEIGGDIFGDAVWSVGWNWTGSLLATTCKDRQIRIIDPRAGSAVVTGKGHDGLKQSKVTWMGHHERLLTTGFDKMNMRQFGIWDARDLSKPIVMKSLGSSSGVSVPLYDNDSDVFFIASKGESSIRVYEAAPEGTGNSAFQELTACNSDQLCRGACLVPKRCLWLMSNEIDRVLKVTTNAVVPTAFYVPRARRIFHEDLYPETLSTTPAIGSAEWLAGENKDPVLIQLRPPEEEFEPEPEPEPQSAPAEPEPAQNTSSAAATESLSSSAPKAASGPAAAAAAAKKPAPAPEPKKPLPNIVRYTKFRHVDGKPWMRNTHMEELRINPNCGRLVCANPENVAFPWAGPGGRIIVLKLNRKGGRVPSDTPFLEHGCEITDMEWNPFDDALLATAGEDARVKLWRIPAEGLKENRRDADSELVGHYKRLNTINFHPIVGNLAATSSMDMSVRLWDISSCESVIEVADKHTDAICNLSWNWKGDLFATSCRDTKMRIFDPRAGAEPTAEAVAHDGVRGFKVTWCGRREYLATCGFSKNSERTVALWDPRKLDKHIATKLLDTQSGALSMHYDPDIDLLIIGGRGDSLTRFFEVSAEAPFLFPLTQYQTMSASADYDLLPKRALDVKKCEVGQMVRLFGSPPSTVERISFCVPRTRMEYFQDDIFPETRANEPALDVKEWVAGENKDAKMVSLQPADMTKLSDAPPIEKGPAKYRLLTDEERAEQNELTRDEMFDRIFNQMRSKKEEESVEEHDAANRAAEAAAGDCAGDDEWDDYE